MIRTVTRTRRSAKAIRMASARSGPCRTSGRWIMNRPARTHHSGQSTLSLTQPTATSTNAWNAARVDRGAWSSYGFDWSTDYGYRNYKAVGQFPATRGLFFPSAQGLRQPGGAVLQVRVLDGQRHRDDPVETQTHPVGVRGVERRVTKRSPQRQLLLRPEPAEHLRTPGAASRLRPAEQDGGRRRVAAERASDRDRRDRIGRRTPEAVPQPRPQRHHEVVVGGDQVAAAQGDHAEQP